MKTLIRKKTQAAQVYYPFDAYMRLKRVAKSQNKALAEWIRDVTVEVAEKQEKKRKKMKFTDMPTFSWTDSDPLTSEKIDEIVYGHPHGYNPSHPQA
ncbi:MAG: hypothetical protein Q8O95_04360 [bacterium]|nr:hypothetical protein [bacterium]